MHRVAVTLGIVALVVTIGAGGAAVWARAQKHSYVHGIDFSIRTQADTNYCLALDEADPNDVTIEVGICAAQDAQHFAFTDNTDGSSSLVVAQGRCLDYGDGQPGTRLTAKQCSYGPSQRFRFRPNGRLQSASGTVCVSAAQAAQGAAVFDDVCKVHPSDLQAFSLSR